MDILLVLGFLSLVLIGGFALGQHRSLLKLRAKLESQNEALTLANRMRQAVEEQFKCALDALPAMIWICKANGEPEYMNDLCASCLDYPKTAEEAVAAFRKVAHPDDFERVMNISSESRSAGHGYEIEFRIRHPGDSYHWVFSRCVPFYNEQGDITRWFISGTDIQDKTEALDQAFKNEQKLRTMIDSLPIFIWSVDNDGICDLIEGRVLGRLGLKPGQLVGMSYRDFFPPEDSAISNYQRAFAGEEFSVIRAQDGIHLELHYSTLFNSDHERVGVVGIGVDITEIHLAQAEKAEILVREKAAIEASRLKSDFLANMSHEIRTPLNGVIGMSRLLRETSLGPEQVPMVKAIEVCSESLLRIVNDVLDISKIEAGKLLLENCNFDLLACLEHVDTIVRIKAREKGLELEFEIDESIPHYVLGDMHRLHQILVNVLSNAVKFTEKGKVKLRCWATLEAGDLYRFNVVVSDTGIGMSESEKQRIFQYFSQADESTTRRFGGTGLGLSIAKNLCEAMGGTISVESHEGAGSQFKFAVVLKVSHERSALTPAWDDLELDPFSSENRRLSIVIAEDNEINSFILQSYLKRLGQSCDVVRDGEQLLHRIKEKECDIILMDIHMPKIDGIMATKRIRSDLSLKTQPYVIAVTASALLEDKEACMAAGMNDFLSKPVTIQGLMNSLMRCVLHGPASRGRKREEPDVFDEFDGDDLIFAELSELFQTQKAEMEVLLAAALDEEDFDRLVKLSHSLRGSLHNFTSTLATPWAEALEAAARRRDLIGAQDSYAKLLPELDQLNEHMRVRLLGSHNPTQ